MKALITGVTGFVGSHLADYLIDKEGIEVHGIRRPRSRNEFIRYDVHYHQGDVTDLTSMSSIIIGLKPDYIFHLAAQSFVPLSWQAPQATMTSNVLGTLNILDAVHSYSPLSSLQIAGSSEEYGQVGFFECPITELQPLRPLSPYGVSKVAADLLAQQYQKSYGLDIFITRAFNHTGPRRGEHFVTSKIARQLAIIKLARAEPVIALGNLDTVRDFTDVRDMVRAYWLAVNNCEPGTPYNIGSGRGYSILDVLNTLIDVSGVKPEIKQAPEFMRPSDVPRLICNNFQFTEQTGWKPEIPFEKTMRDLFDYWIERLK